MKIYVNEHGEIHEVNHCSDTSLKEIEITDGTFDEWSDAKICCYKVAVENGKVTMYTPYVDSRLIDKIDLLGTKTYSQKAYIDDTEVEFTNVKNGNISVYIKDAEGNYPSYTVKRVDNTIKVSFDPLENVADVVLSVI